MCVSVCITQGGGGWRNVGVGPLTAAVQISVLVPTLRNLAVHHHTPLVLCESHLSPLNQTPLSTSYTNPSHPSLILPVSSSNYTPFHHSSLYFDPPYPEALVKCLLFIFYLCRFTSFHFLSAIIPVICSFLPLQPWAFFA